MRCSASHSSSSSSGSDGSSPCASVASEIAETIEEDEVGELIEDDSRPKSATQDASNPMFTHEMEMVETALGGDEGDDAKTGEVAEL